MIRNLFNYLSRVSYEGSDIDHIWSYHVVKVMSTLCLWFDRDAWDRAHWSTKLLNYTIIALMFLLWPLVIIRICVDFHALSVSRMTEGISISLGGCLTFISCIRSAMQRDILTQVVRSIDEKFLAVPKDGERFKRWWQETRRFYVRQGYVLVVFTSGGLVIGLPQMLYMLFTGNLFYDTVTPLSEVAYTAPWWLQMVYQSWNPMFAGVYYSLKEFLWLDLYYQLTVLYQVQADTTLEIYQGLIVDPETEYQKLKGVIKEMQDLKKITDQFNSFMSPYIFVLSISSYIMISISGVSILIQSKDGWFSAIAHSIVFPVYVALVVGIWALIGEMLTESVDSVDEALYNCNWTDAPLRMKKLILLYKIRLSRPTHIRGNPYFIMNWEMFSQIFKQSYYLLTLLADVLL